MCAFNNTNWNWDIVAGCWFYRLIKSHWCRKIRKNKGAHWPDLTWLESVTRAAQSSTLLICTVSYHNIRSLIYCMLVGKLSKSTEALVMVLSGRYQIQNSKLPQFTAEISDTDWSNDLKSQIQFCLICRIYRVYILLRTRYSLCRVNHRETTEPITRPWQPSLFITALHFYILMPWLFRTTQEI